MHGSGKGKSREEIVKQSQAAGIQREERNVAYESNVEPPPVEPNSVYDIVSYIPVGNAVDKLTKWQNQGAEICYLSSRRIKTEIETIRSILHKFHFPNADNLYFRQPGEDYKDVAERLMPDVLIEDDCESIGGAKEMTYTFIKPELKAKIKSVPVPEFGGIDHLPDTLEKLKVI